MSIPVKDSELVPYLTNFAGLISASPTTYHVETATATALDAAADAFILSYNTMMTARANGVRSEQQTAQKDALKKAVLPIAREVCGQIQDSLSVSDALKLGLGIVIKDTSPTAEPIPGTYPGIEVVSVSGRTVKLRFFDTAAPSSKARPAATAGLTLFSAHGDVVPVTKEGWSFEGSTGKLTTSVVFPQSVAPGAQVHFTAFWFNNRKQSGPLSPAASTYLQGGSVVVSS